MTTARRAIKGAAKKTTAKKAPVKKAVAKKTVEEPGVEEPGNSLVMIRIGDRDYPQVTSSRCTTCQSPHRRFIENEVVLGRGYKAIERRLVDMPLPKGFEHPSWHGISRHVRDGHMPTPATVRREIIDIEAKRMGAALSEGESLVTHRVVNQTIIQRGFERMMAGEIDVSTSDLLQAISAQAKIESTSTDGYDVEAMQQTLIAYLEIAQSFIPPEMMPRYGQAISKHPIIKALRARQQADQHDDPQTQSA